MRLLTLNTHSLVDGNEEYSLGQISEAILKYDYDVIALQEVNQPTNNDVIRENAPICTNYPVKNGNFLLKILKKVNISSRKYTGVWCGFKESYDLFEEGVGIITRLPIKEVRTVMLSSGQEKEKWKKRYALGVKTDRGEFYSVHFGWWEDAEESFSHQWSKLLESGIGDKAWLMGDFNGDFCGESYNLVISSGFYDTFQLAKERDEGYTVTKKIDGWNGGERKRIDYIFCNFKADVTESKTIFNGSHFGVVSDHLGVMIETEGENE
ncbi:MAG: endonuclease [Ruminococcaceae bacterium]|nr:endonuclease [Oscillospiraceae bacterium]